MTTGIKPNPFPGLLEIPTTPNDSISTPIPTPVTPDPTGSLAGRVRKNVLNSVSPQPPALTASIAAAAAAYEEHQLTIGEDFHFSA